MEEIIAKTKALSWGDLLGLLKPNRSRAQHIHHATLVGRLVSKKVHPSHIIHPLIRNGWRFVTNMKIEDAGPNRFLFTFTSIGDNECILQQGPWNFKGSYMILQEWNPNDTIEEINLFMVEFWV